MIFSKTVTIREEITNLYPDDFYKAVLLSFLVKKVREKEEKRIKMNIKEIKERTLLDKYFNNSELEEKLKKIENNNHIKIKDKFEFVIIVNKNRIITDISELENTKNTNNITNKNEKEQNQNFYNLAVDKGFEPTKSLKTFLETMERRYSRKKVKMVICEAEIMESYDFRLIEYILKKWEKNSIMLHRENPFYEKKYEITKEKFNDKKNKKNKNRKYSLKELYDKGYR